MPSAPPPDRVAQGVGVITLAIGTALVARPALGRLGGVTDATAARAIGLGDLALVPGLLAGRPRWPWMASRAVLNVTYAAYLARLDAPDDALLPPKVVAGVLCGLTLADASTARALRAP